MRASHLPRLRRPRPAALWTGLVFVGAFAAGCATSGGGNSGSGPAVGTSVIAMDDPSSPHLRRYLIHPPSAGLSAPSVPLVVVLHGGGGGPAEIEEATGFSDLADRERFVVVYPEATGRGAGRTWNAGFCCGRAAEEGVDDVGFVSRVVDHVAARMPIDRDRTYLVGYSEGGMLAYRVAAEQTGLLAAVAVVAGAIGVHVSGEETPHTVPAGRVALPVMIVHSLGDQTIHYWEKDADPGEGPVYVDVVKAVQQWLVRNGCGLTPKLTDERGGNLLLRSFVGQAPVEVVVLKGWGHEWPGRRATDLLPDGAPLRGFDAAEVIWSFFELQTRSELSAR